MATAEMAITAIALLARELDSRILEDKINRLAFGCQGDQVYH